MVVEMAEVEVVQVQHRPHQVVMEVMAVPPEVGVEEVVVEPQQEMVETVEMVVEEK
jgi:hypothetical protein